MDAAMGDSSDEEHSGQDKGMHAVMTYRKGRTYTIESKINCFAKKDTVLDVLTDYPSHPKIFSSIVSSEVIASRQDETDVLQEGQWSILWLSGRFKTIMRMREDFPRNSIISKSLKSTVFHQHDGQWQVTPRANGGCRISHVATSKLKGRLPPGLGKFLAGSFLSEENKIMIELRDAAEERARNEKSKQQHKQPPFAWLLTPTRLRW